jgi:hypothetical protein
VIHHARARALGLTGAALLLALSACGGSGESPEADASSPAATPSASGEPTAEPSAEEPADPEQERLDALWAKIDQAVDRPAIDVATLASPAPPADSRFTQEDVDLLAATAREVMARTTPVAAADPGQNPVAAAEAVYAGQPSRTWGDYVDYMRDYQGGEQWAWQAVSLFDAEPTAPEVIKTGWFTSAYAADLDDGTPSTVLSVFLQAFILQRVPDAQGTVRPVVAMRTVRVAAFEPTRTAEPQWWPSVRIWTAPMGTDGCRLLDDSRMVPLSDRGTLRNAYESLTTTLEWDQIGTVYADDAVAHGKTIRASARKCQRATPTG